MAFYRVSLNGTGIRVPGQEGDKSIIGFYTTRAVRAASTEEAVDRAKALVNADWASGPYQESNAGSHPSLAVEDVYSDNVLGYLTFHNKGYVFYPDSNEN